jgi:hypothetical protein
MTAHIEQYGVDKAFLFFCNHDNILGEAFNLRLPGYESFNSVGDPASAESIAALESIKEVAVKVWEFIKRLVLNLASWVVNLIAGYTRKCKKIDEHASTLEQALKSITITSVTATDEVVYTETTTFTNGLADIKDAFLKFSKLAQAVCHETPTVTEKQPSGDAEASEKPSMLQAVKEKAGVVINKCKSWISAARGGNNEAKEAGLRGSLHVNTTLNKVNKASAEAVLKGVRTNVKQVEVFVSQDLAIYRKQLSDIRVFVQTCEKKDRPGDAKTCREIAQTVATVLKDVNGSIGASLKLIDDNLNVAAKWVTAAKRDMSPDKKE